MMLVRFVFAYLVLFAGVLLIWVGVALAGCLWG